MRGVILRVYYDLKKLIERVVKNDKVSVHEEKDHKVKKHIL